MSFSNLGLSSSLLNALFQKKYKKPYPIQQELIPLVLEQSDVLGIAKTGSGKTASYVLPILQELQQNSDTKNRHVNVLVLVPTRELAVQVDEVFNSFIEEIPEKIKSIAVYGGVSINPQMMGMQNVNILVATPGRLLELVEKNAVNLSEVRTLVLDEADKMLTKDFKEELTKILSFLPKKRQNLLFSATLSSDLEKINNVVLNKPIVVNIQQDQDNFDSIRQLAYLIPTDKKGPLLRYIIKDRNIEQVIVFASSTFNADKIASKLQKNGIEAESIHGKKSQTARTKVLSMFKAKKLKVMVTSDLLARGIDIEFLPYVINYELPRSPKDYIHRIGRTGRAENPGMAISLVSPEEQAHFKTIQKRMKKWVDVIDSENIDF